MSQATPPGGAVDGHGRQLSDDGQWAWDGQTWVPALASQPPVAVKKRRGPGTWIAGGCGCLLLGFLGLAGLGAIIGPPAKTASTSSSPVSSTPEPTATPSDVPIATIAPTSAPITAAPTTAAPAAVAPAHSQPAPAATSAPPAARLAVRITNSTYGSVSAITSPGATCTAKATLPSGRESTAQGLQGSQAAGSDGSVGWIYKTQSNTTKGTGTHTVTCQLNGQTASASAPFTV